MPHLIATGELLAWLAGVPAGVVDGLVIDPSGPGALTTAARRSPSEHALKQGPLVFESYRVLRPGRRALWVCRAGEWAALAALAARLRFDVGCPILWARPGQRPHVVLVLTKGSAAEAVSWPEQEWIDSADDESILPEAVARVLVDAATQPGEWLWDPFGAVPTLGVAAIASGRAYACHVRDARRARVLGAAFEAQGSKAAIVPPYGIGGARGLGQLTIFGDAMGGLGDGLSDGTRLRECAAAGDGLR